MIYAILNHFHTLPRDGNYGNADVDISPSPSCSNDMKKNAI